jgi:hypothetical protein
MAVYFVTSKTKSVAYVRCQIPARALERVGVSSHCSNDVYCNNVTGLPDGHERFPVFVFQTPFGDKREVELVRRLKAVGKTIVVEFDDDMFHFPPGTRELLSNVQKKDNQETVREISRLADVITVSTPELVPVYKRFCPNVAVLPNCIDLDDYPKPKRAGKRLTIGWAAANELNNFALVASTLKHMVEDYDHVDIAIGGDPKAFDMVKVPANRKVWLEPCSIEDFPKMIRNFDIAVIPLIESKFNAGKSELKGLQYGALKIPFLASDVPPYQRFARMAGTQDFLITKQKQWLPRLRQLVNHKSYRRKLGHIAYEVAKSRQIDKNIEGWLDAYTRYGVDSNTA